ncbi:MAG: hypothetical protein RBT03_10460 [Kiritimatiellia bacterium]|jgi:hypothetical protein|nr:hypothetical protein [Kiritimatiellia bacterium]
MNQLRQAAVRERRAPLVWWTFIALLMGGGLYLLLRPTSPFLAGLLVFFLAGAWAAPVLALVSLTAPRRATKPPPASGQGSFAEWNHQARLLGRVLLYYGDIPELPPTVQDRLRQARDDLRDTLRSHPLRDDLERVCGRIRRGALATVKDWLWQEFGPRIQDMMRETEQRISTTTDENERLRLLQAAVENAAACMSRAAMPRMLERERLACAHDCAWLATSAVNIHHTPLAAIELAAKGVIGWSDFSEPWQPVCSICGEVADLPPAPAADEAPLAAPLPGDAASPAAIAPAVATDAPPVVIRNGKRYRRVRVRRKLSRRRHHPGGPSVRNILFSFGQWLRYSLRAWFLYR